LSGGQLARCCGAGIRPYAGMAFVDRLQIDA